ncbi:MAG: hypothetical protein JOY86_06870 [Candidatus Eremiobacteraeota bacterium]|nr:hypothetical protein [Candidatus Eremiobacteraeota bacterium]
MMTRGWFAVPVTIGAIVLSVEGPALSDQPAMTSGKLVVAPAAATYKAPEPSGIALGQDGALWFTSGTMIGRITTAGQASHINLAANAEATVIAAGPGGTVWYSDPMNDVVGKVTMAGDVTTYKLRSGSHARSLTLGPDGNMWLAESGTGRILRMSPSGWTKEFIAMPAGFQPEGIVAGPRGLLWITDAGNNAIVSMSLTGTIHSYPTPTKVSRPGAIMAGKDGNIWFAESNADKIGRLTPGGSFREYPVHSFGGRDAKFSPAPSGLAYGPDGNVWFVEWSADMIRTLSPSGDIKNFQTKTAEAAPWGIVTGADGNIWFTENEAQQIGEITTGGDMSEYAVMPPLPQSYSPAEVAAAPAGGLWMIPVADIPSVGVLSSAGDFHSLPAAAASWLTSASDGSAWFIESPPSMNISAVGSKIASLTPQGTFTEYAIPKSGYGGIAIAPDGTIWLADFDGNKVDKLTLPGPAIASFSVPTTHSDPHYITTDAKGNAWFSELTGNKIGRVTPDGHFTEFAVPSYGSDPGPVAIAPDGTAWFGETSPTGKLGRVGIDGKVTEIPVQAPSVNSGPVCVAVDKSGNVWFGAEAFPNSFMGRLTPSGKIEKFTIPTPDSEAHWCALATDGTFWFAEYSQRQNAGSLGKVTQDGALTEYQIR